MVTWCVRRAARVLRSQLGVVQQQLATPRATKGTRNETGLLQACHSRARRRKETDLVLCQFLHVSLQDGQLPGVHLDTRAKPNT